MYETTTPTWPDVDHGLREPLHRREEAVEVVGPFDQDLELSAALAPRREEALGVLKRVVEGARVGHVVAHHGRDDLALLQRGAVVHGDHADGVVAAFEHHGVVAPARLDQLAHAVDERGVFGVEGERAHALAGEHDELREVERVGALAEDLALRPALPARREEARNVLEVVGGEVAREGLRGAERAAVAGEDVPDAPLADGDQREAVHAVLEGHPPVDASAQDLGLIAGLALERDEPALDGAAGGPALLDHADAVVGDVPDAEQHEERGEGSETHERGRDEIEGGHDTAPRTPFHPDAPASRRGADPARTERGPGHARATAVRATTPRARAEALGGRRLAGRRRRPRLHPLRPP
ncbi:MAG: hypothetical protein R3A52_30085 [Polyangiales bacterium]